VNGTPATTGIDGVVLNVGDSITFEFEKYSPLTHSTSTVAAKYEARLRMKK
jgi:hypothetical protein